jgi:hypothetical protein
MTNFEEQKLIACGAIAGAAFTLLTFYMVKPEPQQPVAPKSNFEVVDTYKGCDVVSWTQPNFAQYKYFLHCPK